MRPFIFAIITTLATIVTAYGADISATQTGNSVTISGESDGETVGLMILRPGTTLDTLGGYNDGEISIEVVKHTEQLRIEEGKFSLELEMEDSDATGVYSIYVHSDSGATANCTLEYVSESQRDIVIDSILTANSPTEMVELLNDNVPILVTTDMLVDIFKQFPSAQTDICAAVIAAQPVNSTELIEELNKSICLFAINSASAAELAPLMIHFFPVMGMPPIVSSAYNDLLPDSKANVLSITLADKPFANATAPNTAFALAVGVVALNTETDYTKIESLLNEFFGVHNSTSGFSEYQKALVYKSLIGKNFSSASAVISALETAKSAQSSQHSPSGGGGGGSGGGSGGGGSGGSGISPIKPAAVDQPTETPTSTTQFNDLASVPWAIEAITVLQSKGIINGTGEGSFTPDRTVTREEFVKMLVLAFNIAGDNNEQAYLDAPSGTWYAPFVNAATQSGIVNGVGDGLFGAGIAITREQAAVMVVRVLQTLGLNLPDNTDVQIMDITVADSNMIPAIMVVHKIGIMTGGGDGTWDPKGSCTRAMAAKIVYMLMQYGR